MSKRWWGFILLVTLGLLSVSIMPVLAQAPSIRVTPVWRPASQLTTIDTGTVGVIDMIGDDIRYGVVDIYATVNVEFRAVGFVCTINKNLLEAYSDIDAASHDDIPMFSAGADWTLTLSKFVNTTISTDGKVNFAIAVTGPYMHPMGSSGVSRTLHIASLRYRVKAGLMAAATSPFTCTTSFLNRDGRPVVTPVYVAPPALRVIPGYSLTGKATYQGTTTILTAAQAIGIQCADSDPATLDIVTTANTLTGLFTATGLRTQGRYDCSFTGNIIAPGIGPDLHLPGAASFDLTTTSFALLPVALRSGDVNNDGTVDTADLFLVTSTWNLPPSLLTTPYMLGDASGDRKINEADLVLVADNYGQLAPTALNHIIYSLPRSLTVFQNSRLWLGPLVETSVTQFVPGNNRDYWPAVSPDGKKIAFVRNVGTGSTNKYALFTAPITNGVVGTATRLTPATATYDAFAPSWSPDGSQMAFVCSYSAQWFNEFKPRGNVCLIDANGANFRRPLELSTNRPVTTRIQPAAWVNSSLLYIAAALEPGFISPCDYMVCLFSVPSYSLTTTSGRISSGTDMPVIHNGSVLGPTVFYRYDDGINRTIRFAQIDALGVPFGFHPNTTPGLLHNDVNPGLTNVDYFTVATGSIPHIWHYDTTPLTGTGAGSVFVVDFFGGSAASPTWNSLTITYSLLDGVGNPAPASGYNEALRNTVAFLP